MVNNDGFQPVKSADRTLEVLEVLAASPHRRGLVELARELDIPKSSLHGILHTMAQRGWVESDAAGSRFGLGLRALQVGAAYLDADDSVGLLQGTLDRLAAQTGETIHLGRLSDQHITYIAKRESTHPLRLYSAIGRRLPAHATALGKALLAQLTDDAVDRMLTWPLPALTANTVTGPDALHAELARVREQGFAVDREENTEGIVCFAMAIPLPLTMDAISISIPTARLKPATEAQIVGALSEAMDQIRSAHHLLTHQRSGM